MYDDAGDQKARQSDSDGCETRSLFGESGIRRDLFQNDTGIRKIRIGIDEK